MGSVKATKLTSGGYIKQQKTKNSIKALACNFLDFDHKRLRDDHKRIKILKHVNENYDILKPDKGNGVVLIKKEDYKNCMTKFSKLSTDSTLTQLTSLQNYLRTIHNRGEISDDKHANIRPQSTKPARARGITKTQEPFDVLTPFRPIVHTTGTTYQPVAKSLSRLLNPLSPSTISDLQDSSDAVTRINSIPQNLLSEGYRFVSFDVKSLFTNIPLKKTVDIILHRIYNEKQLVTTLKKRTPKKLLLDPCTKTFCSLNGSHYKQIDGITMGSPLGPTLANIMTALEEDIVKNLIEANIIKFYVRYVDDTLVLTKPPDIPIIPEQFNSYHPQIQFTHEEFVVNNDVHFLDIRITSSGTTIFRKRIHIGQYIHLSSFTP